MKVNDNMYMLKIPTKMHPDKFTYPVIIFNKGKILLVDSAYPGEFETIRTANLGCIKDIIKYVPDIIVMAPSLDNKSLVHIKLSDNDITPHFENIKVISTPGHTPNHISLYI